MATRNGSENGHAQAAQPDWNDFTHTGPGTLAGRWLRTFWHPVMAAHDLPVGRAKPLRILGEDFTVYRGQSGEPHALAFRCAHRGTQMSTGWVEDEDLRCYFHGWKYDPEGQCIEQPGEPEPFCEKVRVRSYPVRQYLDVIWAYLGEGEAPAMPRFPEFEDESKGVLEISGYTWPCNYFNVIDNDPIHIPFVHRNFASTSNRITVPTMRCEETSYGFVSYADYGSGGAKTYHIYMPHMGHRRIDVGTSYGGEDLICRVPIDDGNSLTVFIHLTHVSGAAKEEYLEKKRQAEEARQKDGPTAESLGAMVLRGDLTIEEASAKLQSNNFLLAGSLFNLQDYVAQVGQGTIVDVANQRLGREDAPAILLRKIMSRELRVLAEGGQPKTWSRPERLSVMEPA